MMGLFAFLEKRFDFASCVAENEAQENWLEEEPMHFHACDRHHLIDIPDTYSFYEFF